MDIAKIKKQYRNQWVLIEYTKLDKHLHPKAGRVIAHAANKDDIYKALLETRGKNVSLEFYGKIDEDAAVMFCLALKSALPPSKILVPMIGATKRPPATRHTRESGYPG